MPDDSNPSRNRIGMTTIDALTREYAPTTRVRGTGIKPEHRVRLNVYVAVARLAREWDLPMPIVDSVPLTLVQARMMMVEMRRLLWRRNSGASVDRAARVARLRSDLEWLATLEGKLAAVVVEQRIGGSA